MFFERVVVYSYAEAIIRLCTLLRRGTYDASANPRVALIRTRILAP